MSDPDIAFLLSVAADYDAAGAQYATLAAGMRRIARRLADDTNTAANRSTAPVGGCVIDGDDIPGVRCLDCGD